MGPFPGETVVDFAALPPGRPFLIVGRTGAGKSFLLDAVCFALFGDSAGGERGPEDLRCRYAPAAAPTDVTLDFTVGDDAYRVRRNPTYEREKRRGKGKGRDTTEERAGAELFDRNEATGPADDGRRLEVSTRRVDERVRTLLGFDANQFRHVVLLPQGRFREVLTAKTKDRQEILQHLFRNAAAETLERRLGAEAAGLERRLEEIRRERAQRLEDAGVADPEALDAAIEALAARAAALGARRRTAEAEESAARRALERGRRGVEALDAAERAAARRTEAERTLAACATTLDAARERLAAEHARDERREELRRRRDELDRIVRANAALAEARGRLDAAEAAERSAGAERERTARAAEAAERDLEARREEIERRARALEPDALVREEAKAAKADLERRRAIEAARTEALAAAAKRDRLAADREAAREATAAAERAQAESELAFHAARAAILARELAPGRPCPVCGSTEHPAPARTDGRIPTEKEIARARRRVEKAREAEQAAAAEVDRAATEAATREAVAAEKAAALGEGAGRPVADLEARVASLGDRERAWNRAARELAEAKEEAKRREAALGDRRAEAERAARTAIEAAQAAVAARTATAERAAQVPEPFRADGALAAARSEAAAEATALAEALAEAETAAAASNERLAAATATLEAAAAAAVEAKRQAEATAPDGVRADIEALRAAQEDASARLIATAEEAAVLGGRTDRMKESKGRLEAIEAEIAVQDERYERVGYLADLAAGKLAGRPKVRFAQFVLAWYLDRVLDAASRRLHRMSDGRYALRRKRLSGTDLSAGWLEIEVLDAEAGGARPAATLSGGEGFLASLALALGLADVVQAEAGGIRLDSMFIDEGFGSLDPDTLDTAMSALSDLVSSTRMLGVISHVDEMRRQIRSRIEVEKSPGGSTVRVVP
jgi:exonuclease SbcC